MVVQSVIVTQTGVGLIKEHEMGSPSGSEDPGIPYSTIDPAGTVAGIKSEERTGGSFAATLIVN